MGIISSCSPERESASPYLKLDIYQCFMTGDMIPSPQGLITPAMNNIVR